MKRIAHFYVVSAVIAGAILPCCAQSNAGQVAERLASGETIPIVLRNTIRADRAHAGDVVRATTVEDVRLNGGNVIKAGSVVMGHVTHAFRIADGDASQRSASLSVVFDSLICGAERISLYAVVRAIASPAAVDEARRPSGDSDLDPTHETVQVGGDRVTPSQPDVRNASGELVGHQRGLHVLARLEASSVCDAGTREVAVGVFSSSACGPYGFGDIEFQGYGSENTTGELTLRSTKHTPTLWRNTAVLLEAFAHDAAPQTANRTRR